MSIISPAERNKGPILEILKKIFRQQFGDLPFSTRFSSSSDDNNQQQQLNLLEIGSNDCTHLIHFAPEFPGIKFRPTDVYDDSIFPKITKKIKKFDLKNISMPKILDVTWPPSKWPILNDDDDGDHEGKSSLDIIYCSNVVHITPWKCSEGLFNGSGWWLKRPNGILIMYGPFAIDGNLSPQSNIDFDQSLRRRNPEWGIRDISDLNKLADKNDLYLKQIYDMPANNKILFYKFK